MVKIGKKKKIIHKRNPSGAAKEIPMREERNKSTTGKSEETKGFNKSD